MDQKKEFLIGILGFGTVGSGTARIIEQQQEEIKRKVGRAIRIKSISSPHIMERDTTWLPSSVLKTAEPMEIVFDQDIDLIVEAIGGIEPAQSYILKSIEAGKSVVTANKLLLAKQGLKIAKAAENRGVALGIEASVAGAIPILAAIRDGLSGEKPNEIHAILNGTTNYIITEMQRTGRPFAEILKVAQELGYAEADPALDVDGIDARDKLSILSMIAFGIIVEPDSIATTGITGLSQDDLRYASDLGYTVKLICSAKPISSDRVALRVTPSLVSKESLFATVNGSLNAILLSGEFGGQFFFSGRGAGSGPTGSAVVGDIIRIARGIKSSPFGYKEFRTGFVDSNFVSRHFVRFVTKDIPGVIARIASIFAKYEISIDSVVQERGHNEKEKLPFVITLKESDSIRVEQAAREMQELDFLASRPYVMPIMN